MGLVWLVVVTLVVYDVINVSKSPYNLVSVAGMVSYILILYIFSYDPARVRYYWCTLYTYLVQLVIEIGTTTVGRGCPCHHWVPEYHFDISNARAKITLCH